MSTEPRTVTLPTLDHGNITVAEPAWCTGHANHIPETYRADLSHNGPKLRLTFNGQPLGEALISQAPCAELGTRDIQAFVNLNFVATGGFDPASLYDFAATLDTHADRLRDLADELHALLGGGQ